MTTLSPQHGEATYTHPHTHPYTPTFTYIHTPQGTHAEWRYGIILKERELCQILQTDLQGGGSPGAVQSELDPPVRL